MTERFANAAQTTLVSAITAIATSFTVASGAAFPSTATSGQFRILIGSELMLVTDHTGNVFTVTRGLESTTAVAHPSGATVTAIVTAGGLAQALSEAPVTVAADIAKSAGTAIDRVQGFQGRALSTTAPLVGQAYAYDGSQYLPVGRVLHLALFGGGHTPDSDLAGGGYDWANAVEAAIKAFTSDANYVGGYIQLDATPGKGYRLGRTVNVTRSVRFKGHGGGQLYPGSLFVADTGVTAFRLHSPQSSAAVDPVTGDGARNFVFEDLAVIAAGKLATTTTGTFTAGSTTLPVSAAGDFTTGQMIAIEGGARSIIIANVTVATTSGNATVTFTSTGDQLPVLRAGQYIQIPSAFPTPTKIASITTTSPLVVVMASNALASVTTGTPSYCPPLITRIIAGGGTTSWTIDATDIESTVTACTIKHADCAFDILQAGTFHRVAAGDENGKGFAGAGFAIRGSHAYVPATNANKTSIKNCQSAYNRFGSYVNGPDSNDCDIELYTLQSTEWGLLDASLLGNTYRSGHADGGQGYITAEHTGNACVMDGCYQEGGTFCSFGNGTVINGGTMPIFAGGTKIGSNCNRIVVGIESITRHTTYIDPVAGAFIRYQSSSAANGGLSVVAVDPNNPSVNGYFQWVHALKAKSHPIVIADSDQTATLRPGTLWLPAATLHGEDALFKNLDTAYPALRATVRSASSGPVPSDPSAGFTDNIDPGSFGANAPYWKKGDWIHDPDLLDGCPTRHIIEQGHRGPEWAASTGYSQFQIICPTVGNHNGRIYSKQTAGTQTSGATEPNWTTAPLLGNTIVDGGITWTNAGTAAYTQPVDISGYIVRAITTSETWAQTDRHFLCGSVEVTGALAGAATLTLPVGRYTRWLWNHTTGGFGLLVKCATGNTVTIANGMGAFVQCTGVEMRRKTADVTP